MPPRLDIELLEAFVSVVETGSFTHASEKLHRTQPAVSMQLKRLEDRVGQKLIERHARKLELTGSGQALFSYAKNIVDMSAEAFQKVAAPELTGVVRIGIPEWFATDKLQEVICLFSRLNPQVKLEICVGYSSMLREKIKLGHLDIALAIRDPDRDPPTKIWREPLYWAIGREFDIDALDPVRLILFIPPCPFRAAGEAALNAIGREWKETLSTTSVAAVRVALKSGLGVSILPAGAVTSDLRVLHSEDGFPDLPPTELTIYRSKGRQNRTVNALRKHLVDHVGAAILNND
ncbi:HTH-type transcriptional regulator BenM [Roseovarius albus]|uniref:HTH-type transcriptional regulator BenM n=1 Tax=Roseovarius albus TaxID=1247867 RepID=A0A1X6Z7E5_9RHOB|nr:LysR family transcriptional regulator [Roseovarius albus]SLN42997.1 HTH-type transcriptional regulator BenM [Roseovarius albus]